MEKFDPLALLAKYWLMIILITALVFGVAWLTYTNRPTSFFSSQSVTVQVTRVYPTTSQLILQTDNNADSQSMVATTQSWLVDPSYVFLILGKAGVTVEDSSLKGLSRIFKVVVPLANSATYQVQFAGESEAETKKVFLALKEVMEQLRQQYNLKETGLKIDLIYSDQIVTQSSSDLPLTPLAGLAAGFIFALLVVAILEQRK